MSRPHIQCHLIHSLKLSNSINLHTTKTWPCYQQHQQHDYPSPHHYTSDAKESKLCPTLDDIIIIIIIMSTMPSTGHRPTNGPGLAHVWGSRGQRETNGGSRFTHHPHPTRHHQASNHEPTVTRNLISFVQAVPNQLSPCRLTVIAQMSQLALGILDRVRLQSRGQQPPIIESHIDMSP